MKKLLMHTCCAPCFAYIEKDISESGIISVSGDYEKVDLTAFWYNPNIHPKVEYDRRKETFLSFCKSLACKNFVIDEYDLNTFVSGVVSRVGEGKDFSCRCEYCYYIRLKRTFEFASENGYDIVGTSLSISPYQNQKLIEETGKKLASEFGVEFYYHDYSKNFREGQKIAKEMNLYRQKYCGCVFSMDSRKVGILMNKYSKKELVIKNRVRILIPIFAFLLIISTVLFVLVYINKEVKAENIDDSAKLVSNDLAAKSTPIIINNTVIGAVYDKTWVSLDKYFLYSTNKKTTDVDVYDKTGKAGEYKLNGVDKTEGEEFSVTTTTTRKNWSDEYFAIAASDFNAMPIPIKEITAEENDIALAKKALGIYLGLNSSIKVSRAYSVRIDSFGMGKILCITADEGSKKASMYSAVIYISDLQKPYLIKYNYVKDKAKAQDWPVYDVKAVADLNNDSKNEIVLQEIMEFKIKYDIVEFRSNKFYEVLSTIIKM